MPTSEFDPFDAGVVQRRLQIVNISWGSRPNDAVGMHVAAWVLGETLMHLATIWSPPDVRLPPPTSKRLIGAKHEA